MKNKIYLGVALLALALVSARMDRLVLEKATDMEAGKFQSAMISSSGKILSGKPVEEFKIEEDGIWSMLETKTDQALFGTGNKARLYQFANGKLEKIFEDAESGRFAIPVIAQSGSGEIYFSVIPKAVVYKLEGRDAKKLAEPGVNYLWTLVPLANKSILAGGGPKATIFLIKPDGSLTKLLEPKAEMVVEIIDAGDGEFFAGTARPAMLLSFKLDGSYRVLASFQQEELRAIRKLKDKSLLIALNQGAPPQMPMMEQEMPPQGMGGGEMQEGGNPEEEMPQQMMQIQPRVSGRSVIYRFYQNRGMKQILSLKQATILSLFGDEQNGFFVGTDDQGKVYQVFPALDEVRLSYKLEPAKITSFAGTKSALHFIGTSHPSALFKILDKSVSATYESKVMDAQFTSIWGRIEWRGKGKVKFATRSGNTSTPDDSWSQWEPVEGPDLKIKSPSAKFIQVKAEWQSQDDIELSRLEISFRNFNQAHYLSDLKVDVPANPGDRRVQQMSDEEAGPPPQRPTASVLKQCSISWRLENPDKDELLMELYYQMDGDTLWTKIAGADQVKGNRYQWDATGLADGWYRVKLSASDKPSNTEDEAFQAELISNLFLIDTTKPDLTFTISGNGVITGEAKDATSDISKIEYAVDDEDFAPALSLDSVLDQKIEKFELKLKKLSREMHRITIRVCDQANNCALKSQEFSVK